MTEQEFYIWLFDRGDKAGKLPDFNPEFLKNYEITKLVLEKFGLGILKKKQYKLLNQQATLNWFRMSKFIHLKYNIPEVLELLPEEIKGNLTISYSKIQSLPKLKSVGGSLYLQNSKIESLPQLEYVGGYLNLRDSPIRSLPELHTVGRRLILKKSNITSLPKLQKFDICIVSFSYLEFWKCYFENSGRSHLAKRVAV